MSTIPCKRPKVTIDLVDRHNDQTGRSWTAFQVNCHVTGCDFTYLGAVSSDAKDHATWHRQAHRSAVPVVVTYERSELCECGWRTAPGCVTKTDRAASVTHHLSTAHGLVA